MSLHIYIAHTGEQLLADPVSFASPDGLKTWIFRSVSIPPQRQILMTAHGKSVRLQSLVTENEIFVYDRQFVSEHGIGQLPQTPAPEQWAPDNPPDFLSDQNNLQAWRDLYKSRRSWALNLTDRCTPLVKTIDQHHERTDIIYRAVGAALENVKSHVGSLENKFQEAQAWANDLLKEQQDALDGWQHALTKLETIPVKKDVSVLRQPSASTKSKDAAAKVLKDYIDLHEINDSASQVSTISQKLAQHTDDLRDAVSTIVSETEALVDAAQPPPLDNPGDIIEELETIARKISFDYEHVLGLPNSSKTLSSVSRMALNHTKDLLPSMVELSHEIHNALAQSIKQRNSAMVSAVRHMHSISGIESRLSSVQAEIAKLDVDPTSLDTLCTVFHFPAVYGSVLIESVRRQEWTDKLKTNSSSLAEELAVYRDEEQRRRKKWIRNMGDYLSISEDNTPSVEVNLQGGQNSDWPEVSRTDIEEYIQDLKSKGGLEPAVEDLSLQLKDLDNTRPPKRKSKAFKHGSFVDIGRSSLMLRGGDDMVRSLKDEKAKLEDRLKGSESRVRKLEDLLHRQNQAVSRPVSSHFGPDIPPMSPASPRPEVSRRSSASSRRMSSNNPPEDRGLIQRIIALEAELTAEKELVAKLQREANIERQSSVDKMEEIQSTKKDLIQNLEAQQREFGDERKFLEAEAKDLRIKAELLEEELDKAMDAREQEKHEANGKIDLLKSELNDIRKTYDEETTSLKGQVKNHQGRCDELSEKNRQLQDTLQEMETKQNEYALSLQAIHAQLSPEGAPPPAEFHGLINAIEILSEGLAIHAKRADETAAHFGDENKSLLEKVTQLEDRVESLERELEETESGRLEAQEELSTVQTDLETARKELSTLRTKFANGESGTEVLKERVAEEEHKVAELTEKLAALDVRTHGHNEEIISWKRKVEGLEEDKKHIKAHFETRGSRAESISQRIHTHIEILTRMLEQLGFTIVFQDNQMTIQRTSKVNSASTLGESLAASVPPSSIPDANLALWTQADNPEEESLRYTTFIEAIEKFDVNTASEVLVKRVKDIETLARKWQKEARGYRDKYHRLQSEAHDKIAYRSFKEGDLALFLPTRNQSMRSWAAFNIGAPHYFLREQDVHRLNSRDWLVGRITKMEERVVDLSKSMNHNNNRPSSVDASDGASIDDDNPFELSDGLRWYLLDAAEEKPGAPSTPGLGKSTVASAHVDAKGSIRLKRAPNVEAAARTLTRSLDSRRNSSASKRGVPPPTLQTAESSGDGVLPSEGEGANASQPRREQAPIFDQALALSGPSSRPVVPSTPTRGQETNVPSSPSPSPSQRPSKPRGWEKLFSLDYRSEGR